MPVIPPATEQSGQIQPTDQSTSDESVEEKEPGCDGPQRMCPPELNELLYRLLTIEDSPQISCSGSREELYQNGSPSEADFTWKADYEFIQRELNHPEFKSSPEVKLRYSRWGPSNSISSNNDRQPVKLLLLHDVLDCRKGWWCCQKLLSPFFDTVSIDLLGSGASTIPRGINDNDKNSEVVPWSYEFHAKYLIEMIQVLWPTEKVYVAGVGWGAQIAITMASISDIIAGVIMINPPSLTQTVHPEPAYTGLYHLSKIPSDDLLDNSHVSIIHLIRQTLSENISNKSHHTNINLILDQYCCLDRKRVLIDQLVGISDLRYQELPRTTENEYGLKIENIKAPVFVIRSDQDQIYPVDTSNLCSVVYYNSIVRTARLPESGHFAHLDSPSALAELIIDFIRQNVGIGGLGDMFIGFGDISQVREMQIITKLRDLYKV